MTNDEWLLKRAQQVAANSYKPDRLIAAFGRECFERGKAEAGSMTTDTTTPTDYASLIERLEKGSGDDWRLATDIEWATSEWVNEGGGYRRHKATGVVEKFDYTRPSPPYLTSLDAALAFAEAVIGKDTLRLDLSLSPEGTDVMVTGSRAYAATPARAVLIATLKALRSKDHDR